MDANFTAGPWEAKGTNGKYRVTDWDVTNDALSYYATVPVHVGGYVVAMVVDGDNDDELLDANARLIAAAPTLYAVVKYAVDNPDFDSGTFDTLCREALSKATGAA